MPLRRVCDHEKKFVEAIVIVLVMTVCRAIHMYSRYQKYGRNDDALTMQLLCM